MDKASLAILVHSSSDRNPVVLFCLRELVDKYNITVITFDSFHEAKVISGVKVINLFGWLKWTSRSLLIITILLSITSGLIELFIQKVLRQTRFRFNNLRNLINIINYFVIEIILMSTFYVVQLFRVKNLAAIISVDAGAMTAARWFKHLKRVPYIYWAYEIYPNQFNDTPKLVEALMARVERNGCRHCDLIIVTSNIWAKFLRRRYRLYNLKHKIICVCPPPVVQYANLELSGDIKFYYHGAYMQGRGLENLIRAMQHISGGMLYLRGIGRFENVLRNEASRLAVTDKVKFLPPVPTVQLAEEATKFDVGVNMVCMTTLNAKFVIGFKTFENISAGLPLFSPASFQLKEIIRKNNVGLIYSDCSEKALAESLQYCIDHKDKIREWKLNARYFAERQINPEYQRRQLLEAVHSTLKMKNPSLQK